MQNDWTILQGTNARLTAENEGLKIEIKNQLVFINESKIQIQTFNTNISTFETDKKALADENH